jgi:GH35 family endo-1,4-beta-xylanase
MRDIDPQRGDLMGTLFDKDGKPKPAYYAVQQEFLDFKQRVSR